MARVRVAEQIRPVIVDQTAGYISSHGSKGLADLMFLRFDQPGAEAIISGLEDGQVKSVVTGGSIAPDGKRADPVIEA